MRKGFTLVELLFVMAIIAILAGFAIANLKDSTKVAEINGIKNDLKNLIAQQQTYFAANQEYFDCTVFSGDKVNGMAECGTDPQGNLIKVPAGKNNGVHSEYLTCDDGSQGFFASIYSGENSPLGEYGGHWVYNSCTDGTIIDRNI